MAEMVVEAFLSSLFGVVLERLASSNLTDYFRRVKLDTLVDKLESILNSINQVLDDAEKKQYENPDVKTWVGDVKHAMYEADQLLDEIATDAPLKKMRVESQPSSSTIFNFIPTFTNPFKSRLKELIESLDSLDEQKDKLQLKKRARAYSGDGVDSELSERLPTTHLVDASRIYGRDDDKDEMIKFLLSNNGSDNQVPVVSIVGLGGMGKTTFAKLVYNHHVIGEHFELKAWVYVSEPLDVIGLTKAILKSFHSSSDDESDFNLLQQRLQHILSGKKYLLVLDDIWNKNEESMEQLLLPFNHGSSGSKIIVTTRDNAVADVLNSTKLFDLQQLEKNDCWSLFVTHAFRGKNVCEYPNFESIGKKIVDKCGGLPLAVKTLGQVLRKKFSQHEWMKMLETDMWRLSDGDNNINPVLRLSYHNLPSNQKRCFAYCSIFPKGYQFEKGELIKLWMAEGLLKCYGTEKSEEELGNVILGDLESISFFQQPTANNYFGMHDLVNDLAKSIAGEFSMHIYGAKVEGILERTRHIWWSLQLNCVDKLLEPIYELKGLRSLLLEDRRPILIRTTVQREMFSRLKYLRMLSFYGCDLSEVVDEISNLKLLRYLDLSFTGISSLPDTICMLCNLQTLLLCGCSELTELPSYFSKLINLRHLELPYSLQKMPKNIGSLTNLQTLTYFIVKEKNGSDLKELEKLYHLRGRIHIKGLGKVIDPTDVTTRSLKDKKYLEEIEMTFDGEREDMDGSMVESNVSVLEALEPNSNLKMLTIREYRANSFPNWVSGSHLPNLVSLTLESMKNWEEWLCIEEFPLLKELFIRDCPKLKRAPLPLHLPSLQSIEIHNCEMLDVAIPNCDNIVKLNILRCGRILVNELSSSLKKFVLLENQYVEFSMNHLANCPFLEVLELDFKDIVECPSMDLCCYNSLRELSIRGWKSSSLPFSLHLFTHLFLLKLSDCPVLESFPMGGFPSNLIRLEIFDCPKLKASREEWGFLHLKSQVEIYIENCPSLEHLPEESTVCKLSIRGWGSSSLPSLLHLFTRLNYLKVSDCPELESFPMGGFPSNLIHLEIVNCPKLIASKEKWGFFKSLRYLYIDNCPSLECLPEESLRNSLISLGMNECPSLEEKYKKEGGERWHTISHILSVKIDGIQQH